MSENYLILTVLRLSNRRSSEVEFKSSLSPHYMLFRQENIVMIDMPFNFIKKKLY